MVRSLARQQQHQLLQQVDQQEAGHQQDLGHRLLLKVPVGLLEVLADLGGERGQESQVGAG